MHKCPDTNLHLVVEPDVHEEAVHVGPEQRRANQMRQTLQEEKTSQTSENATKVQQSQRTIDLAQIIEAARLVPMFWVYIPPSSRFKTVRVSSFCWKQKMIFWRMWVTKQWLVPIDFHSMEKNDLLSQWLPAATVAFKGNKKLEAVNYDNFHFWWTIPLNLISCANAIIL